MKLAGYHILLIPEDPQKTKRVSLSRFTSRLLVIGLLSLIPVLVGAFVATIHYQNKVVALKRQINQEQEVVAQKEILSTRLSNLERAIARTSLSLKHLQKALDVDSGELVAGLGPVDGASYQDLTSHGHEHDHSDEEEPLRIKAGTSPHNKPFSIHSAKEQMNQIGRRILGLQSEIEEVYEHQEDKIQFLNATPNLIPVDGWLTSGFGIRKSPQGIGSKMHYGIDIAAPIGTPIAAPADGVVILSGVKGGYGKKIVLDHGYGVSTVFAHASELFVNEGDQIKRGQLIAAVGSTGASTGPHLHYEVHVDGIPLDPLNFIIK